MQITKQDVEKVWKKLGVVEPPCKHHHRGFLVVDGVRVLNLHYSFGQGAVPNSVAHLIRKSLKLSVPEFQKLFGCTLGRDEYLDSLRGQGLIPQPNTRGVR